VKHGVNVPLGREFESYCHWGDDFGDFEQPVASWC
jgi:hypothetical protein